MVGRLLPVAVGDGGEWYQPGADRALLDSVEFSVAFGPISWVSLGKVSATAGENTLEIEGMPDAGGLGFDCWVLARESFRLAGEPKPAQ
jgi:hypothetical protein